MTDVANSVGAELERFARRATPREPPPALESFAANLYDALLPLAWLDAQADYHLAKYVGAIGAMFQDVEKVARDTEDGPGWSAVVDLERCPDAWLPWLAQFAGVTVPPGATPAQTRAWIDSTDGFKRGTPAAIRAAIQPTLTGARTVFFRERSPDGADPPYTLEVVTLADETPDPAATRAAIIAAKPGGLVLIYSYVVAWDYTAMTAQGGTYANQSTQYATYGALTLNQKVS